MGRQRNEAHYETVRRYYMDYGAEYCAVKCGSTRSRMLQIASALGLKRGHTSPAFKPGDGEWVTPPEVVRFWQRWDAGHRPAGCRHVAS